MHMQTNKPYFIKSLHLKQYFYKFQPNPVVVVVVSPLIFFTFLPTPVVVVDVVVVVVVDVVDVVVVSDKSNVAFNPFCIIFTFTFQVCAPPRGRILLRTFFCFVSI